MDGSLLDSNPSLPGTWPGILPTDPPGGKTVGQPIEGGEKYYVYRHFVRAFPHFAYYVLGYLPLSVQLRTAYWALEATLRTS